MFSWKCTLKVEKVLCYHKIASASNTSVVYVVSKTQTRWPNFLVWGTGSIFWGDIPKCPKLLEWPEISLKKSVFCFIVKAPRKLKLSAFQVLLAWCQQNTTPGRPRFLLIKLQDKIRRLTYPWVKYLSIKNNLLIGAKKIKKNIKIKSLYQVSNKDDTCVMSDPLEVYQGKLPIIALQDPSTLLYST